MATEPTKVQLYAGETPRDTMKHTGTCGLGDGASKPIKPSIGVILTSLKEIQTLVNDQITAGDTTGGPHTTPDGRVLVEADTKAYKGHMDAVVAYLEGKVAKP